MAIPPDLRCLSETAACNGTGPDALPYRHLTVISGMLGRHAAGFFTDGAFAEIRFERATAPLANVAWLDLGADAALPVTCARSRVIPSFVEVSGVRDHRAVDRGGAWRVVSPFVEVSGVRGHRAVDRGGAWRVVSPFVEVSGVRDHRAVDRGGAWRAVSPFVEASGTRGHRAITRGSALRAPSPFAKASGRMP